MCKIIGTITIIDSEMDNKGEDLGNYYYKFEGMLLRMKHGTRSDTTYEILEEETEGEKGV